MQVLGHLGQLAEMKTADILIIQHHRAVQPLTAITRLAKLPFEPQTACKDYALKKQSDHCIACFEYEF